MAKIPYSWVYPEQNLDNAPLTYIKGVQIQLMSPGSSDYVTVAVVAYPATSAVVEISKTGQFAIRHIVLGHCGTASEPSDGLPISIDCSVPQKPQPGRVDYACPH